MAVHLINTGEKITVRKQEVPKGGKIEVSDASLAQFLIRRRGFKRENVASQDDK